MATLRERLPKWLSTNLKGEDRGRIFVLENPRLAIRAPFGSLFFIYDTDPHYPHIHKGPLSLVKPPDCELRGFVVDLTPRVEAHNPLGILRGFYPVNSRHRNRKR